MIDPTTEPPETHQEDPPAEQAPVRRGPDVINDYLKTLPSSPGVYRMIDASGDVIYVGKARSLKARVSNYIRLGGHTNRIARMIAATASMEFVTTRTESEALLLEANLIKRFRPRFNVLLRDDKSFPYILISRDHGAPRVSAAIVFGFGLREPDAALPALPDQALLGAVHRRDQPRGLRSPGR
jgi:excinuclease ABC subunit C